MNIQAVLRGVTPYNAETSYVEFAKVMENAYTVLSFWGNRNVYAVGYKGSVYLEDLIQKMNDLIDSHPHFNEEERAIGKVMQAKVTMLYNISDDQKEKARHITQLFMFVVNLLTPIADQMYDRWLSARSYNHYTRQQHKKVFNSDPTRKKPCAYLIDEDPRKGVPVWWAPLQSDNTENKGSK